MAQRSAWLEFLRVADMARGRGATDGVEIVGLAEAALIDRLTGWERQALERDRLRRLRDLIAPGTCGRAAQRAVSRTLDCYRRAGWIDDRQAGLYAGVDAVRALCFVVMKLSGGRLSARKLQNLYTCAQRTPTKLRSEAA